MALDSNALRTLLCERLCEEVRVEERPDGALMLRTHFAFPDGDRYPFHLSEAVSGGLRLSDRGHTLMHISYDHDVDSFLDGTRGMILERIMGETGLRWLGDRGALCLDTAPERLPEAVFAFGQALTRVYDLTQLSRSNVGSTRSTTILQTSCSASWTKLKSSVTTCPTYLMPRPIRWTFASRGKAVFHYSSMAFLTVTRRV